NNKQKQLDGFNKLSGDLSKTSSAMGEAKRKAFFLQNQLIAIDAPTQKMKQEFRAAEKEVKKLTTAHDKQTQRLDAVRNKMQQAGIPTKNLSAYEKTLSSDIAKANAQMQSRQAQLNQLAAKEAKLSNLREKHGKSMQHTGMVG